MERAPAATLLPRLVDRDIPPPPPALASALPLRWSVARALLARGQVELREGVAALYYGLAAPYHDAACNEHHQEPPRYGDGARARAEWPSLAPVVREFLCYRAVNALNR